MVHIFYIFLFLSDFALDSLDKIPLFIYGGLGWCLVVSGWRIALPALMLFVFALYLFATAFILENTHVLIQYAVLFFLYTGLLNYILVQMKSHPDWFDHAVSQFVSWQSAVIFIGCFDYVAFSYGYISPIRDYLTSNKVDSLFSNPNPFGVMSGLAFCFIAAGYGGKLSLLTGIKCVLCIGGVLLSDSSSALLLPLCFFVFKLAGRARFYFSFLVLLFGVAGIFCMDVSILEDVLNKRLAIWGSGFEMWADSIWFGIGTGNFQLLNSSFGAGVVSYGYGLHSMYMWLIIETGLIGSGIGLGLLLLVMLRASKHVDRALLYPVMLSILLSQVTEFFLDHEEVFSMLFFIIVARVCTRLKHGGGGVCVEKKY